jgi:hypothetical protein
VGHRRAVRERDDDALTLPNVDHRPGNGVAERPRLVVDAGSDRNQPVLDRQVHARDATRGPPEASRDTPRAASQG